MLSLIFWTMTLVMSQKSIKRYRSLIYQEMCMTFVVSGMHTHIVYYHLQHVFHRNQSSNTATTRYYTSVWLSTKQHKNHFVSHNLLLHTDQGGCKMSSCYKTRTRE